MDETKFWCTPSTVRRFYLDLDFGQCHVRDNGARSKEPLPVFCLHPLPLSGRSHAQLLKALAPVRYAVAPDLPGYGLSDRTGPPSSLSGDAEALLALAAALGLSTFAVASVSASTALALEMARLAPDAVVSLVLIDPDGPEPRRGAHLQSDGGHLADDWSHLAQIFGADRPVSLMQRDLADALQSHPDQDRVTKSLSEDDLNQALEVLPQDIKIIRTDSSGRDWSPGYLDLQSDQVADVINAHLGDARVAPFPGLSWPGRVPDDGRVRRGYAYAGQGLVHYRICEPRNPRVVPLTCFHASPQSGVIFDTLLLRMGRSRIALAPDTPGFGESDGPDHPPEIADYAQSMAALLDALGISQTDLLGFHTGSMTAIELARQRPDLVRRIVMVSAPIFTDEELAAFRAHYKPMRYQADGAHNVEAWQSFWGWRGPKQSIEDYARNNALTLRGGPNKHWGHRAAFNYPLGQTLGQVACPILVLNPGDDLRDQTLRAEPFLQNGSILDIAPLSHGMFDDSTDQVAALLENFLDGD